VLAVIRLVGLNVTTAFTPNGMALSCVSYLLDKFNGERTWGLDVGSGTALDLEDENTQKATALTCKKSAAANLTEMK